MNLMKPALPPTAEGLEQRMIEQLDQLALYQNYERAFGETTGLSLRLAPANRVQAPPGAAFHQNSFCELFARHHPACVACQYHRQPPHESQTAIHTFTCFAGRCQSRIPILSAGKTIGFLLTGEVAIHAPSPVRFAKIIQQLKEWHIDFEETQLRHAYFTTRVMSGRRYNSILDLLAIFADHLSRIADQWLLCHETPETPNITRALEFIRQHITEPLDLKQVADQAHLSTCYFCKKFKLATGLTFTQYVTRTRVETAKTLLLNPQVRVSEVAFEVGFQSLTHFNRVFREITGDSPTKYRQERSAAVSSSQPLPERFLNTADLEDEIDREPLACTRSVSNPQTNP